MTRALHTTARIGWLICRCIHIAYVWAMQGPGAAKRTWEGNSQ